MTPRKSIRIASRGSRLALWQAETVRDQLLSTRSDLRVDIEVIKTTGDRILDVPLARIGDRGLFTKEIDAALLSGRAQIAVHSLKDVPTRVPEGLVLAAVTAREDARDVLIGPAGASTSLTKLGAGTRVGTSSLRRRAQLKAARPDVHVADLRGNLNTRLEKLDAGEYDAIILAAAGVLRLGLGDRISERLQPDEWLPAVGQGALGIVARSDDPQLLAVLAALHDDQTASCTRAERSFLRALEGGCQIPIGALATVSQGELRLDGLVADVDGTCVLRDEVVGPERSAEALGAELAERLRDRGADDVLAEIRRTTLPPGVPPP